MLIGSRIDKLVQLVLNIFNELFAVGWLQLSIVAISIRQFEFEIVRYLRMPDLGDYVAYLNMSRVCTCPAKQSDVLASPAT